jgi:glyoxylase-like metal-dependent hydrolase (beta-lactamase superfamily II)
MWDEVGDRCYRWRYENFDLNIGVVVGADGFFVIDTRCGPTEAHELLDDLRTLGSQPVRRILNSHWHFDHCWGNATIRAEYPEVEIWGHERIAYWNERFTVETQDFLRARHPEWSDEIDEIDLVLPDHYVHDELTVDLGDRGVSIRCPGRGHTDNDLVAVVSDTGTVFAGDIVEESAPPSYGDDCFPLDWPESNARLLSWIEVGATVVPGHGDVIDRAFVAEQNTAIGAVATTIRELHAGGVAEADALAAAEWTFPRERLTQAVRRGYAELSR